MTGLTRVDLTTSRAPGGLCTAELHSANEMFMLGFIARGPPSDARELYITFF